MTHGSDPLDLVRSIFDSRCWVRRPVPGYTELTGDAFGIPVLRAGVIDDGSASRCFFSIALLADDHVPCLVIGNNGPVYMENGLIVGESFELDSSPEGQWRDSTAIRLEVEGQINLVIERLSRQYLSATNFWNNQLRRLVCTRKMWGLSYLDEASLTISAPTAATWDLFAPSNVDLFLQCVLAAAPLHDVIFGGMAPADRQSLIEISFAHRKRSMPELNSVSSHPEWSPI